MANKDAKRPWEATRRALAGQLAEIDGVLPGSVVVRRMRCGKSKCACHDDPPTLVGPYIQWTRTAGGKTVTRYLSDEELARYQPWFDNARRLKEITAELEIASLHALEIERSVNPADADPPDGPKAPSPGAVHLDETHSVTAGCIRTFPGTSGNRAKHFVSEAPGEGSPWLSLLERRTHLKWVRCPPSG